MLLIGLHGERGAGKDTAFESISRWAQRRDLIAVRRGFADKLKLSAARALGFPIESVNDAIVMMDSLKIAGEVATTIPGQSVMVTSTGREFLQCYGTEAHRDVFGENFWVDALLPLGGSSAGPAWENNFVEMLDYNSSVLPDIAVVTDVRFVNEAKRIKALGGMVWEIERPALQTGDTHASEQRLPGKLIDLTIVNRVEGSLEEFDLQVMAACAGELHIKLLNN